MSEDLKIIKNKYGEKMMHLCRELFPTILEQPSVLSKILLEHFEPTRFLYEDIVNEKIEDEFKNYIYQIFDSNFKEEKQNEEIRTPSELLNDAGYILYECKTEEDIQNFKKYYAKGEELCTFKVDRLKRCYVFFAVKKDADEIRREDFLNPKRQDRYGTSVISIQFTKDHSHILSIKNRYNHTVPNPDATFSNNLDNIIEGLTESFERIYGLHQKYVNEFEIPGYVLANDGKYYKYNYEIDNIYYCPNNIIIDNFEPKRYPQEKYIVMDYFILDLKTGKIQLYDNKIKDSFIDGLQDFEKIEVHKENQVKKIIFKSEGIKVAVIVLDSGNNIIGYENLKLTQTEEKFLCKNRYLSKLNLPKLKTICDYFLPDNIALQELKLPEVVHIGDSFLSINSKLKNIELPNLVSVGCSFLRSNEELEILELPKLEQADNYFMILNEKLKDIQLPKLTQVGDSFLMRNIKLKELNLPNLISIGNGCLINNIGITNLKLPKVKTIGSDFLNNNEAVKELNLPELERVGSGFLTQNTSIVCLDLPQVELIGHSFLEHNEGLRKLNLPNLKQAGKYFLKANKRLQKIDFPCLETAEDYFLFENKMINIVKLPKIKSVGKSFLEHNENLVKIDFPKLEKVGDWFLGQNILLKQINFPCLREVDAFFLKHNTGLRELNLPELKYVDDYFVSENQFIKSINLPKIQKVGINFLYQSKARDEFLAQIKKQKSIFGKVKYVTKNIKLILKSKLQHISLSKGDSNEKSNNR